jgi:hypothetical protein
LSLSVSASASASQYQNDYSSLQIPSPQIQAGIQAKYDASLISLTDQELPSQASNTDDFTSMAGIALSGTSYVINEETASTTPIKHPSKVIQASASLQLQHTAPTIVPSIGLLNWKPLSWAESENDLLPMTTTALPDCCSKANEPAPCNSPVLHVSAKKEVASSYSPQHPTSELDTAFESLHLPPKLQSTEHFDTVLSKNEVLPHIPIDFKPDQIHQEICTELDNNDAVNDCSSGIPSSARSGAMSPVSDHSLFSLFNDCDNVSDDDASVMTQDSGKHVLANDDTGHLDLNLNHPKQKSLVVSSNSVSPVLSPPALHSGLVSQSPEPGSFNSRYWQIWSTVAYPSDSDPTDPGSPLLMHLALTLSGMHTLAPGTYIDMSALEAEYWTTFHERTSWPVVLLPPLWATHGCEENRIEMLRNALKPSINGKNHFGAVVFGESHFWFVHGNQSDIHVLGNEPYQVQYQQYQWQDYLNMQQTKKGRNCSRIAQNVWKLAKLLFKWNDVAQPKTIHLRSWKQNGTDCALHAVYMAMACMTHPMNASNIDIDTKSPLLCTRHGRARLQEHTTTAIRLLLFELGQTKTNINAIGNQTEVRSNSQWTTLRDMMTKNHPPDINFIWDFLFTSIILPLRESINDLSQCTCKVISELPIDYVVCLIYILSRLI